jgi:hypothetical protein
VIPFPLEPVRDCTSLSMIRTGILLSKSVMARISPVGPPPT